MRTLLKKGGNSPGTSSRFRQLRRSSRASIPDRGTPGGSPRSASNPVGLLRPRAKPARSITIVRMAAFGQVVPPKDRAPSGSTRNDPRPHVTFAESAPVLFFLPRQYWGGGSIMNIRSRTFALGSIILSLSLLAACGGQDTAGQGNL